MKYWIHSLVDALAVGVFFSHSINNRSSSGPAGIATVVVRCAFRFFGLGGPLLDRRVGDDDPASSALRFLFCDCPFCTPLTAVGLPALLPGVGEVAVVIPPAPTGDTGLLARLARGLPLRPGLAKFGLIFGTFGLVARFATTECPPRPGTGDVARDAVVGTVPLI